VTRAGNNNNNNNNNSFFSIRLQVRKAGFALLHVKFTSEHFLRETLNNEGEGFAGCVITDHREGIWLINN
jgi:hypothetical protein